MTDATERDAVPNEPDAVAATEGDTANEPEAAEATEDGAAANEPGAVEIAEQDAAADGSVAAGVAKEEAPAAEPEAVEATEHEAAAGEPVAAEASEPVAVDTNEGDAVAGEPGTARVAVRRPAQHVPFCVSHVAGYYRRYPGEEVTLFTRVELAEPVPGYTLHVSLPEALVPVTTHAPGQVPPLLGLASGRRHLVWNAEPPLEAGVYEYRVVATVAPTLQEAFLRSTATVSLAGEPEGPSASETVGIAVYPKGRYLHYLPSLYERDELMGRFVMLFESFREPIESRITHLPLYFDPRMAPADLLPWLASWFGLVMDERWPEERRRALIRSAATLYRRRGTRRGLREYLELLGEEVEVIEHFGGSFRLGPQSALGPEAVLGTSQDEQHTFTVAMHLPASLAAPEHASQVAERTQTVRTIIETDKPAHTGYSLRLEYDR